MAIGSYSLSSQASVPGRGGSSAGAAAAAAREIAGSLPRFRMGLPRSESASALRELGGAIGDWERRKAADAAQELQDEISERAQSLYDRLGTSAEGVTEEFTKMANEVVWKRASEMSTYAAETMRRRLAPWLSGRRMNLAGFEQGQVRKGNVALAAERVTAGADNEIAEIAKREMAEENEPTRAGERAKAYLAQLGGVTEERFRDAYDGFSERGFLAPEEIDALQVKNRGRALTSLVRTLLDSGCDNVAEAILDQVGGARAEGEAGAKADGGAEGSEAREEAEAPAPKGTLAELTGLTADDIAGMRKAITLTRDRRAAEEKRAEEEHEQNVAKLQREYDARIALREVDEIGSHPYPKNDADVPSYYRGLSAFYAGLAADPDVSPTKRLAYAKTARELGYNSISSQKQLAKDAEDAVKRSAVEMKRAAADAVKANQDALLRAFHVFNLKRAEGRLTPEEAAEMQSALVQKFHVLVHNGGVSPWFIGSFQDNITRQLTKDEARAMRKFYQSFGYEDAVTNKGEIPDSVQKKDATTYYAPQAAGADPSDRVSISADDLFYYGDAVLQGIRGLGDAVDREAAIDNVIKDVVTHGLKKEFFDPKREENRVMLVKSLMDYQRGVIARQAGREAESKEGEGDGGRGDDWR